MQEQAYSPERSGLGPVEKGREYLDKRAKSLKYSSGAKMAELTGMLMTVGSFASVLKVHSAEDATVFAITSIAGFALAAGGVIKEEMNKRALKEMGYEETSGVRRVGEAKDVK